MEAPFSVFIQEVSFEPESKLILEENLQETGLEENNEAEHDNDAQIMEMGDMFFCSGCNFNGNKQEADEHISSIHKKNGIPLEIEESPSFEPKKELTLDENVEVKTENTVVDFQLKPLSANPKETVAPSDNIAEHDPEAAIIEMGNKFFCSGCDFIGGQQEAEEHINSFLKKRQTKPKSQYRKIKPKPSFEPDYEFSLDENVKVETQNKVIDFQIKPLEPLDAKSGENTADIAQHDPEAQIIEMGNSFFCSACEFSGGQKEADDHIKSFQRKRKAVIQNTEDHIKSVREKRDAKNQSKKIKINIKTEPQKQYRSGSGSMYTDGMLKCQLCPEFYPTGRDGYTHHMSTKHTMDELQCDLCGFSTNQNSRLIAHLQNMHSRVQVGKFSKMQSLLKEKPKQLPNAGGFVVTPALAQASLVKGSTFVKPYIYNYKCGFCFKSFDRKGRLTSHIETLHSKEQAIRELTTQPRVVYGRAGAPIGKIYPKEVQVKEMFSKSDLVYLNQQNAKSTNLQMNQDKEIGLVKLNNVTKARSIRLVAPTKMQTHTSQNIIHFSAPQTQEEYGLDFETDLVNDQYNPEIANYLAQVAQNRRRNLLVCKFPNCGRSFEKEKTLNQHMYMDHTKYRQKLPQKYVSINPSAESILGIPTTLKPRELLAALPKLVTHAETQEKKETNKPKEHDVEANKPTTAVLATSSVLTEIESLMDITNEKENTTENTNEEVMEEEELSSEESKEVAQNDKVALGEPTKMSMLSMSCHLCNFYTSHAGGMKRHTKLMHTKSAVNSKEKITICNELNKRTRDELPKHQCPKCDKSFPLKGNLTRHLLSHTGLKPFMCSQCDKSYTQSGNLRLHERVMHGDKEIDS